MEQDCTKNCITCGKQFNPGSRHKQVINCSRECYKIYATTIRKKPEKKIFLKECATCKKQFNPGRHKETINCSPECRKIYALEHKDERMQATFSAIKEKYGVDHPSQIPGHYEKVKKTKLEHYGDENFNNREQAKETSIELYGVDNPMKLEATTKKTKQTKLEKHGDENYNNREQAKNTIKEVFGVEHHLQRPDILEKMKQTNLAKYGTKYNLNTDKCRENAKAETLKNHGVEYFFSSDLHWDRNHDSKIEKLKILLDLSNIEFDLNVYDKLRNKNEDGSRNYLFYKVKCKKCNNEFDTRLINQMIICRKCNPYDNTSKSQREISEFLTSLNVKFFENHRKLISPKEVDFYLPEENMAIEFNGNYFHSEYGGGKNKKYHLNKSKECKQKEVKLIHIFEDEWLLKKEIVKSRIRNMLGKTTEKIYGRKCEIKIITSEEKKIFLISNHIQGNSTDKERIGLFYNNELVSVMTFSKMRIALGQKDTKEGEWELNRFCSKLNTNVIGSFQKMLSFFLKTINPKKITTFADCRWSGLDSKETVYHKNGFNFIHMSPPSYFYLKTNGYLHRQHRFSLTKHKLIEMFGGDKKETEINLALKNGYDRIWDCGALKFELNIA